MSRKIALYFNHVLFLVKTKYYIKKILHLQKKIDIKTFVNKTNKTIDDKIFARSISDLV